MSFVNRYIEVSSPYIQIEDINYWESEEAFQQAASGYINEFVEKLNKIDEDGDTFLSLYFKREYDFYRQKFANKEITSKELEGHVHTLTNEVNSIILQAKKSKNIEKSEVMKHFDDFVNLGVFTLQDITEFSE